MPIVVQKEALHDGLVYVMESLQQRKVCLPKRDGFCSSSPDWRLVMNSILTLLRPYYTLTTARDNKMIWMI